MLVEIILFLVVVFVYFVVYRPHQFWRERGVKCAKPVVPLLGNIWDTIARRTSLLDQAIQFYDEYPCDRYSGVYQLNRPVLLVRDLELIKKICVKDFEHFIDHTGMTDPDADFLGKSLIFLQGDKWREMRSTLSPAFTSSKMRHMFLFMDECAKAYTQLIKDRGEDPAEFEMKDFFSRYTSDVIASAGFGVNCNSLKDPSNEFYQMGKQATAFSGLQGLKMFIMQMMPSLGKRLKLRIFSKYFETFFKTVVGKNIKQREEQGIVRPDFIHLLVEARKGKLKHESKESDQAAGFATVEESEMGRSESTRLTELTDDVITAQALLFFFAGFDAASTLCCFLAHELSINRDVQTKLQNEIDATMQQHGGNLNYETLIRMKYLDQVISEGLRLWTPGFQVDRLCVKDYVIKPVTPDEKSLLIEKGQSIVISVAGIHRDPHYFPDPLKFDPERFSDENKGKIIPGSFLPFGVGPRNCIGSRFALLEVKAIFFHLLSEFDIVTIKRTTLPLVLSKKKFNMTVDDGFWYGFKPRKTTAL